MPTISLCMTRSNDQRRLLLKKDNGHTETETIRSIQKLRGRPLLVCLRVARRIFASSTAFDYYYYDSFLTGCEFIGRHELIAAILSERPTAHQLAAFEIVC